MTTIIIDKTTISIFDTKEEVSKAAIDNLRSILPDLEKIGGHSSKAGKDLLESILPPDSEIDRYELNKVKRIIIWENISNIRTFRRNIIDVSGGLFKLQHELPEESKNSEPVLKISTMNTYDLSYLNTDGFLAIFTHSSALLLFSVRINVDSKISAKKVPNDQGYLNAENPFGIHDDEGNFDVFLYAENRSEAIKSAQFLAKTKKK